MNTAQTKPKNLTTFICDSEHGTQRIDNFLFQKLKNTPKSHIYKMLRKGSIRINKKRAKPEYHLQAGDVIVLPYIHNDDAPKEIRKPNPKSIKELLDNILYEDENFLVLNKPSGIASHGGSGINFGVIELMRAARPLAKSLELVHRLDRETSGCLIIAKKRSILKEFHELIRAGRITKKYWVLVHGLWRGGKKTINAALHKNQLLSGERIVKVNEEGKTAITYFRPLKIFKKTSLLEAELKTGRTHQIRVHATHAGYPVVCDAKYGNHKADADLQELGLKRLFLHAESLNFYLKSAEKAYTIKAPLPKELEKILKLLEYK